MNVNDSKVISILEVDLHLRVVTAANELSQVSLKFRNKQEIIPVGCVPPAFGVRGGENPPGKNTVPETEVTSYPTAVNRQTGVKALPSRYFVCGQ